MDFKNIHIGKMIEKRMIETNTDVMQICSLMDFTAEDLQAIYDSKNIETEMLLNLSKFLEYDFFRMYSQHMVLFSSLEKQKHISKTKDDSKKTHQFRKNIYTKEIIEFILESVNSGEKTKQDIIDVYHIPKTTLYKWFSKYNSEHETPEK
ncbi:transposase [Chryseobacterium sp. GP-SGM7]|uniref:transposase n=1 Tax=Chryseobacterium sp. GP-SGM7 TaxID=3411323 RepID=UPI003B937111